MAKVTQTHSKYKGVIVSKTDMRKLRSGLQAKMKDIADLIIQQLSRIGEECVSIAREPHVNDYNDITGNLRSSIGYVILYDGKPVQYGASKIYAGSKGKGEAGPPAAEALLQSLQAKFPWGIVLIVCAGMNYAAYVENIRHKDVLTTSELKMESLARKLLNGLTAEK